MEQQDLAQLQLQINLDLAKANIKIQLMSLSKDLYLNRSNGSIDSFLTIYRGLLNEVLPSSLKTLTEEEKAEV